MHCSGGPHYAPRSVRSASLEVLDALFPMGRRSRRLVRLIFRLLHPAGYLGGFFFFLLLPMRFWSWASGKALRWISWWIMLWLNGLRLVMGMLGFRV